MFDVYEESNIPYGIVTPQLFPKREGQLIVPFLGAGASIRDSPDKKWEPIFPSRQEVDAVITALQLAGDTYKERQLLIAFSLAVAYLMASSDPDERSLQTRALEEVLADDFPPSAGKLAEVLADAVNYSSYYEPANSFQLRWPWKEAPLLPSTHDLIRILKLLVRATNLWGASDSLSSLAAYYETAGGRPALLSKLKEIFEPKQTPKDAHLLIARCAGQVLKNAEAGQQKVSDAHYLIITTNYDTLMENALKDIPYVVLVRSRKDEKIYPRFSPAFGEELKDVMAENPACYPDKFFLEVRRPIVIIYKPHGCLAKETPLDTNSVVISDFDYEDYLASMSQRGDLIPQHVLDLMKPKPFLFMGYSFNDWNVRATMGRIMRARGGDKRDFAIMKEAGASAQMYCRKEGISICKTELKNFCNGVRDWAGISDAAMTARV